MQDPLLELLPLSLNGKILVSSTYQTGGRYDNNMVSITV